MEIKHEDGVIKNEHEGIYQRTWFFEIHGHLDPEEIETVLAICHRKKHWFKEGFEHGVKTRRELESAGVTPKEWKEFPGITFTYYPTPIKKDILRISFLRDTSKKTKLTEQEIIAYAEMWREEVIAEIKAKLKN